MKKIKFTKQQQAEVKTLIMLANQMSNVCFSIGQGSTVDANARKICDDLRKQWDQARSEFQNKCGF